MDKAAMQKAVRKIYPNADIVSAAQFKQGLMNRTYDVSLQNPKRHIIFRVYPRQSWKAKKEQYLYSLVKKCADVPVPDVLAVGDNYSILTKVGGRPLSLGDAPLIYQAGRCLAKLHAVKFSSFGWIVGKKIAPKFASWEKFILYDTAHKLSKFPKASGSGVIAKAIKEFLFANRHLLDLSSKPSLLHKDYHASHILVRSNKLAGIIDFEWAIAGHNELDLAKSCLWMFKGRPAMEKVFLKGYRSYGTISKQYPKRKKLYQMLTLLSSLSLAYECGNKEWCRDNSWQLKKLLGI